MGGGLGVGTRLQLVGAELQREGREGAWVGGPRQDTPAPLCVQPSDWRFFPTLFSTAVRPRSLGGVRSLPQLLKNSLSWPLMATLPNSHLRFGRAFHLQR